MHIFAATTLLVNFEERKEHKDIFCPAGATASSLAHAVAKVPACSNHPMLRTKVLLQPKCCARNLQYVHAHAHPPSAASFPTQAANL